MSGQTDRGDIITILTPNQATRATTNSTEVKAETPIDVATEKFPVVSVSGEPRQAKTYPSGDAEPVSQIKADQATSVDTTTSQSSRTPTNDNHTIPIPSGTTNTAASETISDVGTLKLLFDPSFLSASAYEVSEVGQNKGSKCIADMRDQLRREQKNLGEMQQVANTLSALETQQKVRKLYQNFLKYQ